MGFYEPTHSMIHLHVAVKTFEDSIHAGGFGLNITIFYNDSVKPCKEDSGFLGNFDKVIF